MATPLKETDLDLLSKHVEQKRKELEDDMRALARVRRMLDASKSGAVQAHLPLEKENFAGLNFNEAIRRAARNSAGKEFTVPEIEAVLKSQGVKLPAKKSRPRISTVLKGMADNGELVVVRKGSGKTPHVYRTA